MKKEILHWIAEENEKDSPALLVRVKEITRQEDHRAARDELAAAVREAGGNLQFMEMDADAFAAVVLTAPIELIARLEGLGWAWGRVEKREWAS